MGIEKPCSLKANWVYCAKAPVASYQSCPNICFPELPKWANITTALITLRSLFVHAGLDHSSVNSPDWNPLGSFIQEGEKVVVKPNWVNHRNISGHGTACLITHSSVIEAILHYVCKARPQSIVVGDAPIQGCDFGVLVAEEGVGDMIARFTANGFNIGIKDFRRTILPSGKLGGRVQEACRPMQEFLLYDLGSESSLEAITTPDSEFRVTMYRPDLLKRTHSPGKHQYLVARDVMEADVVINVPKLKTHKKACLTGALKNLVGINGHKEYLPHHRKGCPEDGGDCYADRSLLKKMVEDLLDSTNRAKAAAVRQLLAYATRAGIALGNAVGCDNNYDGSWHGNDTVWRMTLDLQRILHYGRPDGTLTNLPQRRILTITDAIVAGQGDGPLSPTPVNLGMLTLGINTAALEWVHALLMGLTPERVPLVSEAFSPHPYPLAKFPSSEIVIRVNGELVSKEELFSAYGFSFRLPKGWDGHFKIANTSSANKSHRKVS